MYNNISDEPTTPPSCPVNNTDYSPRSTTPSVSSNLRRLSIHITMAQRPYLQPRAPHQTAASPIDPNLPENPRSAVTPPAETYSTPDMASNYPQVSSYDEYSIGFGSSLPTPVSVAGSPAMVDRASSTKMLQHFSPNDHGSPRQMTPPGTTRPTHSDWYTQHSNMHSEATSSPMSMHGHGCEMLEMHGLEVSHPSDHQAGTLSAPDQPYWGAYGVSNQDQTDDLSPHMPSRPLYMQAPNVAPSELLKNPLTTTRQPLVGPRSPVPMLQSAPHPEHLGPVMHPMENINYAFGFQNHQQPQVLYHVPPSSNYGTTKRNNRQNAQKSRDKQRVRTAARSKANRKAEKLCDVHPTSQTDGQGAPGAQRIKLDDRSDELLLDLFNLRCQCDDSWGSGMWDEMLEKYKGQHPDDPDAVDKRPGEKARLQMKLSRGVLKHAIWIKSEDDALIKAYEEFERDRYKTILKLMKAHGGVRAWEWGVANIRKRLVELGLEKYTPLHNLQARRARRRKESARQQSTTNLWDEQMDMPRAIYDSEGYCIETRGAMPAEPDDVYPDDADWFKMETESPEPEMSFHGIPEPIPSSSSASGVVITGFNQAHSERVARQACEREMANQQSGNSHFYGPTGA